MPTCWRSVDRVFEQPQTFGSSFMSLAPARDESRVARPFLGAGPRIDVQMVTCPHRGVPAEQACRVAAQGIARRFAALRDAGHAAGDMVLLLGSTTRAGGACRGTAARGLPVRGGEGLHLQPGAGGEAHGAPGAGHREPVGLARPVRGAFERVVRAFRGRLPGADHGPRRGIGRVSAPPAPVRPHGRRGWRRRRGAVASAGRGRAHRGEDGARHGTDAPVGHHGRDGARFRLVLAHGTGGCRRTGARGERAEGGPHGRGRRACGRGGPGERGRAPGRAGGGGQGGARRAFPPKAATSCAS